MPVDALHAVRSSERAALGQEPAQCPDQRVMVGLDDRGPGDDEDVPARLERGRHHPERLAESSPDPIPDHGAAELSPGRQSEPSRLEVGPQEPDGEQRVGPGRPRSADRREVLRAGEHHEPRRVLGRAPSSGRQLLSTTRASGRQDASTRGRLHPGAEAVLLGAMALLGLIGLLHGGGPGSSPSGLGDGVSRSTPRGTQTRPAPESAERVVVRRMIRPPRKGCQTRVGAGGRPVRGRRPRQARCRCIPRTRWTRPAGRRRTPPTRPSIGYSREYCRNRLATARRPVLSSPSPSAPGRRGRPGIPKIRDPGARITRSPTAIREPLACPRPLALDPWSTLPIHRPLTITGPIERMDAKQVWRAALGELQVSLSPANYETWLRDTQLVDVDDNRFRISVPNGFAKDWLETRYRSLISQTLARIVGYSVQVEFVIGSTPPSEAESPRRREPTGRGAGAGPRRRRLEPAGPRRADPGRRRGRHDQPQSALHVLELHRRLGQPPGPRRQPVGRRAPRARLQPAVPVRRRGPGQDPPDARDRQPGHRQVPAQARRLRDEREVHERVHHLDPAGQDRRVPRPLPADRPAPHRRHPVHRRQGADPGGVLPHVQRDPRGRQADRHVLGPAAEGDPDPRGAAPQSLRVGPHRRPDGAGPRDPHRDPAGQGRGGRAARSPRTSSSSSPARS